MVAAKISQFTASTKLVMIVFALCLASISGAHQPPVRQKPQSSSVANADFELKNRIGMTAFRKGRYDDAYTAFTEAIALNNADPNVFFNRGLTAIRMGKYRESLADLDEAIKLGLNDGRVYSNRGVALDGLGRHAEAITDYDASIKLDPRNATSYYNRGETHARVGNDEAAIADYSRAIEIEPKFASAYVNRGTEFLRKHNYPAAISDYSAVIKLEPKNGHMHGCLAAIYATCPDANFRNGAVAIEYATKANKLGEMPQYLTLAALAAANAESGDFDQAVKWQTKSIEAAPESDRVALKIRLKLYQGGKPFHGDFFNLTSEPSE